MDSYRQFGSMFRTKSLIFDFLIMAGLSANEFIWRNSDLWDYGDRWRIFRLGYNNSIVLQLDGITQHKKHRRLAQGHKFATIMPLVPQLHDQLCREICAVRDTQVDLLDFCRRCIIAMVYRSYLQVDLPKSVEEKIHNFSHAHMAGDIFGLIACYRLSPLVDFVTRSYYMRPKYKRIRREALAPIYQALSQRDRHPLEQPDVVSQMIAAHPTDEPPLTRMEIAQDILFLHTAASEPTAGLLSWTLLFLYHHPEWQEELRTEVRDWSADDFSNMKDLPKLRATILEVERLRPSVPRFMLFAARDFEFEGVRVSKGTRIIHPAALTHFLDTVYPDPFDFNPRRFLDVSPPTRAHASFGGGVHFCLGQPLARVVVTIALAELLKNHDVVMADPPSLAPIQSVVLTPVERVLATIQPR